MALQQLKFIPTPREDEYVQALLNRGEYNTVTAILHDAMDALREKRKREGKDTFVPPIPTSQVSE